MEYEIDVIGVGKESKSGDAIAVRWGNLHGGCDEQKVVLIDGGFQESGQDIVNHIKHYYETTRIDAIVSTHPDQDHVNGLHVVLDELTVKQLWIHKPWEHNQGLSGKFLDGRITDESVGRRLKESLESASNLVGKAIKKGVHIVEPFRGISLYNQGEFIVIGPTKEFYESLIPEFDGMPEANTKIASGLIKLAGKATPTLKRYMSTWGVDALDDNDTTSAKNNSSTIILLAVDDQYLLFTGDAGITALNNAADQLDAIRNGAPLRFIQIPHHGSRRNVGPTILNRLVGEPVLEGEKRPISAIASTAKKGDPKHPRKAVMNALTHRGVSAMATRGKTIRHHYNAPKREGWTSIEPEAYYYVYDDEE
ncbi:MAG: MBL fold metallo-hydrolase [Gammaproteobacteria bacterium]|nr:MBL fold metallo-hydrolase [Gammaproteobacteria bacterium]